MTEKARISNSIWNFRIRSTLRSGVSTKSFLLFIVYFREIAAFQELTRMPSIHKTTKKQINYKQVPTKTLVSFFTSLLLLQFIRCVKISHRQPHRFFGLFCLWPRVSAAFVGRRHLSDTFGITSAKQMQALAK